MFAITGITGQVGGAVANALLADGKRVRAVTRSTQKAQPWVARGCDIAVAEMDNAGALTSAFAGAEGVFILLPPIFDPTPGFAEAKAVVAAVRQALAASKPGRVVCLSTVGAQVVQPNLLNQLGLMERELGALDLPMAFLRAAWFMENTAWDIAPARERGIVSSFRQPLDRAIPMIATADIGELAAQLLQERWTGRRIVELTGPAVSPNDIAAALSKLLARPVHIEEVRRDKWEDMFRTQGMRNPLPRMQMLDGFNEGWISSRAARTSRRRAAPRRSRPCFALSSPAIKCTRSDAPSRNE
jgi:uncharacterized protein YbjT (DUF2867 family)